MQRSQSLHEPWMKAPLTHREFIDFYHYYNHSKNMSFLLLNESDEILGVFNLSEIVRGIFQSAYLGFSAVIDYAGQGYMSLGLKLLLGKVFNELELHRLEANIEPTNTQLLFILHYIDFIDMKFQKC